MMCLEMCLFLSSSPFCFFPILASEELAGNSQCWETWVSVMGTVRRFRSRVLVCSVVGTQYTTCALMLVPVSSDRCSLWLSLFCLFNGQERHREKRFQKLNWSASRDAFCQKRLFILLGFLKVFCSACSEIYRDGVDLN